MMFTRRPGVPPASRLFMVFGRVLFLKLGIQEAFWPLLLKLEFLTWVRSGAVALVAEAVVSRVIP
jgi:hypothetical protein